MCTTALKQTDMRVVFVLCLVAVAASADYGWKTGSEYQYKLEGRSLTGLHQLDNQYSGLVIKGKVHVVPKTPSTLIVKVVQPQYAEVHTKLSAGWEADIPQQQLNYKPLPLEGKPFQLNLKDGVIANIAMNPDIPTWEANILKGIATQLQVNTLGRNLVDSPMNVKPDPKSDTAFFTTMEKSVTGECETAYDISPLPPHELQVNPHLAPLKADKADQVSLLDVVRTRKYTNCDRYVAYDFGISGLNGQWETVQNSMGSAFSRSSVARVILEGNLQKFTVQSSVVTNQVIVSPALYHQHKGIIASRVNITLVDVRPAPGSVQGPVDARLTDPVYEYNSPFGEKKVADADDDSSSGSSSESDESQDNSSSSSSSSSSSEDQEKTGKAYKKYGRPQRYQKDASQQEYQGRYKRRANYNDDDDDDDDNDNDSSSSSSSSSEEEVYLPTPSMEQPPSIPLLPYFVANEGRSIQSAKQINHVAVAKKIAYQIAGELQQPASIPKQHTLQKFSVLARIIRTMNYKQTQELTRALHDTSSSQDSTHALAWKAFRDAVVQAGTGPAFLCIKNWIKERKVVGNEAAQIIAMLPEVARTPTPQYVEAFFELVKSNEIQGHAFVNSSAILAFSRLVHMAQVNNATSTRYYPVSVFGRITPRNHTAVYNKYIPYFQQELKRAVTRGDSPQIQVYTRALGNIGHPKVLSVFEPYLEGKLAVSDFQRLCMVLALKPMVKAYPNIAIHVLYKIYQNTGESPHVRCAAVHIIMAANPSASMLQRMAQFTNYDQSNQVSSAVKSAIQSAATLQGPRNAALAANARAALHLLDDKHYGIQYSKNHLRTYYLKNAKANAGYKHTLSYFGSPDTLVPSSLWYGIRTNKGGFLREKLQFGYSLASLDDAADYIDELLSGHHDDDDVEDDKHKGNKLRAAANAYKSRSPDNSWTTGKIADMLDLQTDEPQQVEGNVNFNVLGIRRYFAFDNHTIKHLLETLQYARPALKSGMKFNITKLYSRETITLAFPNPLGLVSSVTLKRPTLVQLGGQATARASPAAVNVTANIRAVFSTLMQFKLGIFASFNHKRYVAALDKHYQLYVPIKFKADIDMDNADLQITIEPQTKSSTQIVHVSTVPYTSVHDILQLAPVIDNSNTKIIHVHEPRHALISFGQHSTGMAFHLSCDSDRPLPSFKTLYEMLQQHDAISWIFFGDAGYAPAYSRFSLTHEPHLSSAHSVKFTASYDDNQDDDDANDAAADDDDDSAENSDDDFDEGRKRKKSGKKDEREAGSHDNPADPSSTSPNCGSRQQQFLHRVGAGIKSDESYVVDLSVQFDGPKKAFYIATAAYAESIVDDSNRLLVYLRKEPAHVTSEDKRLQVCVTATGKWSHVPVFNLKKALSADPTSSIYSQVSYGETCSSGAYASAKCDLEQSDERQEYVRHTPMTKLCQKQMDQYNNWLPACLNASIRANYMDQVSCSINFRNTPQYVYNATYHVYSAIRHAAYKYMSEDVVNHQGPKGKAFLSFDMEPSLEAVNVTFNSSNMAAKLTNVPVSYYWRPLLAVHPNIWGIDVVADRATNMQYNPTCVADDSYVNTFDNLTYPIHLGKCWHVLMTSASPGCADSASDSYDDDDDNSNDNVTILVRDSGSSEREVKILLGEDTVDLTPGASERDDNKAPTLRVNGQSARVSRYNLTQVDGNDDETLVQATVLAGGAMYLIYPDYGIEMLYDGRRVMVQANDSYRAEVRGLCGTFDGEDYDEFTSPQNCLLKEPHLFAASYALTDRTCQGDAKELQRQAAKAPCYYQDVVYADIINDMEAGRTSKSYASMEDDDESSSSSDSSSSSSSEESGDNSDDSDSSSSNSSSSSSSDSDSDSDDKDNGNNNKYKSSSSCLVHRVKVLKEGGHYCFSQQALPQCAPQCDEDETTQKKVNFHCVADSQVAQHWASSIKKGANPDFSRKPTTKSLVVNVARTCSE